MRRPSSSLPPALALEAATPEVTRIFNSLPIAIYSGAADSFHWCNTAGLALFGFDNAAQLPATPTALFELMQIRWPETGERLQPDEEPFFRALHTGETVVCETAFTQIGTGREIIVECTATPLRNENIIVGAVVAHTDITERIQRDKAMEAMQARLQTLGRSEEKVRQFMASNVIGILHGHLDGTVHDANDELLRLIGRSREDLETGHIRWSEYTAPEYRDRDETAIKEAKAHGRSTPYEKEYVRPDGTRVPVLLAFVLVGENHDETIAFALDLSAVKRTEARARRVVDAGIVGIINWNLDTSLITDANDSFLQMLDYTREELQKGLLNFRAMTPPEWQERSNAGMALMRTGRITPPYEKEYFRRDGSRVPVLVGGALFDDSAHEGVSFVVDISDQKRLEKELSAAWAKQSRIAETLQRSLLIGADPGAFPAWEIAMYYEPAWQDALIGGDFYDVFPLRDGSIALIVGDVTGKGLEAAAFTAEVKFALRAYLREDGNPGDALGRLNRFLVDARTLDRQDSSALVCLSLAIVQSDSGKAQIAVAGAEPPLLIRAPLSPGEPAASEEIWSHGLLLGVERDAVYETTTRVLNEGDVLLLLTDGVTEARRTIAPPSGGGSVGDTIAIFGYEGFERVATKTVTASLYAPDADAEANFDAMGEAIALAAKHFADGALQDDICLLIARRRPLLPVISCG